jgi:fumarate reductase iron-sulfur subunit
LKDTFTISVFKWDPKKKGVKPSFSKYDIPESAQMSVLDALQYAREHIDGTLAFNYSCQKQRCGSCALQIDGKISLACYTPVRDGQTISPLPGFQVLRDLIVDWTPYEQKMQELIPLEASHPSIHKVSQKVRDLSESAMTCIKCFSCVGACPSVDIKSPIGFAGPAISVMLASYMDREQISIDLTSSVLNARLEYCTRCYACNSVCPVKINIVGCIQELQDISGESDQDVKHVKEMVRGYF